MQKAGSLCCLNLNQLQPGPCYRAGVGSGRMYSLVTHRETMALLLGKSSSCLGSCILASFHCPCCVYLGHCYAAMCAEFYNRPSAPSVLEATPEDHFVGSLDSSEPLSLDFRQSYPCVRTKLCLISLKDARHHLSKMPYPNTVIPSQRY